MIWRLFALYCPLLPHIKGRSKVDLAASTVIFVIFDFNPYFKANNYMQ